MKKEVCLENLTHIERAFKNSADRIELCDNLAVGGTTPSIGVIKKALELSRIYAKEMGVIVRPRGGDFIYNRMEKEAVLEDITELAGIGIERMVVGALSRDGEPDTEFLKEMVRKARSINRVISFTFHMAFDHIREEHKISALKTIENIGFDTLLTHGSNENNPIFENIDRIKNYAKNSDLIIMPGGGITYENIDSLAAVLPEINYMHGTKIIKLD